MTAWRWEIFEELVNAAPSTVTNPGPLRQPIESLSIRRGEEGELVLTTTSRNAGNSAATQHPPGTVRRADEFISFSNPIGFNGLAHGVVPRSWSQTYDVKVGSDITTEESSLYSLELLSQQSRPIEYTIEWIENFQADSFLWFGQLSDKTTHLETMTLGSGAAAITLTATISEGGGSNQNVYLRVGGTELYLGTARSDTPQGLVKPGFILYRGAPDEGTREKIRHCLSFALGNYLVNLGSTTLDAAYQPVSITAVSANRISDRIFKLPPLPPAPLETRYQREVDAVVLSRIVNSIYAASDELGLRSLSWAYWHALCAPVHIAAAHFGAAIEALQDTFVKAHPEKFPTRLIPDDTEWRALQKRLTEAVRSSALEPEVQTIFENKVAGLNSVPISKLSEQVFTHLGIPLGELERTAWRARHVAAHGGSSSGDPIKTIKDTKLLKGILDRLVLKIANAGDVYRDYYTVGHPIRKLNEPMS